MRMATMAGQKAADLTLLLGRTGTMRTYAGILRHDRIEWTGAAPEGAVPGEAVRVQVTILDEPPDRPTRAQQGRRMREALEAVAQAGGLPGSPDGVQWQRDARAERPLPGRGS